MTDAEIKALRQAAAAMHRDGQVLTADQLIREATIAEAFDGYGYPLGAPNCRTLQIADTYLGKGR